MSGIVITLSFVCTETQSRFMDINAVSTWIGLKFNQEKCKIMLFLRKGSSKLLLNCLRSLMVVHWKESQNSSTWGYI